MTIFVGGSIHAGQDEIIQGIISDEKMYNVVVVGRQFGKTYMLEQVILYYALNNPEYKCLWISPSIKQFNKVKKELISGMDGTGAIKHVNNQDSIITLINGSVIMFGSSESYDKLRGESVDVMVIDEAAFIHEDVFNEVLRPMLLVRGKKCILASTPSGRNFFYTLAMMENVDNRFKTYRSNKKNPFMNEEEVESARKTLPEQIFRSEYLAEFVGDGGVVFSNLSEICVLDNYVSGDRFFGGLDLGNLQDFTCLSIFNQLGEMVHIYRNNRTDWTVMVNEIRDILNKYRPIIYIEVNSIGDPVFNFLQKGCHAKLIPFVTTNKSKQDVIEELILSFNEKRIKLPTKKLFAPLYSELETFTFEYSPVKRVVVYKALQAHNDDCVISLALAHSCWLKERSRPKLRIL